MLYVLIRYYCIQNVPSKGRQRSPTKAIPAAITYCFSNWLKLHCYIDDSMQHLDDLLLTFVIFDYVEMQTFFLLVTTIFSQSGFFGDHWYAARSVCGSHSSCPLSNLTVGEGLAPLHLILASLHEMLLNMSQQKKQIVNQETQWERGDMVTDRVGCGWFTLFVFEQEPDRATRTAV